MTSIKASGSANYSANLRRRNCTKGYWQILRISDCVRKHGSGQIRGVSLSDDAAHVVL